MPEPEGPARCHLQLLVTSRLCRGRPVDVVRGAIRGGVDLIQVREKNCTSRERARWVRAALDVAGPEGVPVLVNDDVEVASRLPVAGVHLGQEDGPVGEALRRLPEGAWIGISTHSPDEVRAAHQPGVTHLGLGACFVTRTRPDSSLLAAGALRAAHAGARLPVFAIGGITPANLSELVRAGVRRVAVCACVLSAADPEEVARSLRLGLDLFRDQN